MFNCEACGNTVGPNVPAQRWPLFRRGTRNLYRELKVCGSCAAALKDGVSLAEIKARHCPPCQTAVEEKSPVRSISPPPRRGPVQLD